VSLDVGRTFLTGEAGDQIVNLPFQGKSFDHKLEEFNEVA
jgi:hypothetical protein